MSQGTGRRERPARHLSETDAARVIARLRRLRELRGMTQDDMAADAGMSRSVLATIETGQRARGVSLTEALTLCRVLGVDLGRLADPEPLVVYTGEETI